MTTLMDFIHERLGRAEIGRSSGYGVHNVGTGGLRAERSAGGLYRRGTDAPPEGSQSISTRQPCTVFESVPERSNTKDPAPLKVKEVWVKERRYIVCLNEEERRKDAHDREAHCCPLKGATAPR
jgi:hypothetical protein